MTYLTNYLIDFVNQLFYTKEGLKKGYVMAKAKEYAPIKGKKLGAKLPTVECTPEMKESVQALAIQYKEDMGQPVSMADIVRWALQSFIEVKRGK